MSEGIIIAIISGIFTLLSSLLTEWMRQRSRETPPQQTSAQVPNSAPQTTAPATSQSEDQPSVPRAVSAKLNTNAYLCISLAIFALMLSETFLPGGFSLLVATAAGFTGFRALKHPGDRVPTWVGLVLAVLAAFAATDTMMLDASIRNYPGF